MQDTASPESAKQQLESLSSEVNDLSHKKINLEQEETSLNQALEQLKQNLSSAQNKKAAVNPLFLVLSIVLAAGGGAVGYFVSYIAAAILIAVAAVLLTLAFIVRPKDNSSLAAAQNELATASEKLSEAKLQKNILSEQINNLNA